MMTKKPSASHRSAGGSAGSRSSHLFRRPSGSSADLTEGVLGGRGQGYSTLHAYDPLLDVIEAHRYASERKDLKFRQIFRYAKCIDWLLMLAGLILAIVGSFVPAYLYYWGGVTVHDVLVFERCPPANVTDAKGKQTCNIKNYCGLTLYDIGKLLSLKILYGWMLYNFFQLGYCICFTVTADRQTKAIRAAYFESIVRKDMAWFDLYADRDFAKEMTEQVTHIRLGIGDVIPSFFNLICTVITMTVIVFLLDYKVACGFLSFIPICMLFVYVGNFAEKKRGLASDKMFEKANLVAKESLVNIKVIKMYEAEKKQVARFCEALDDEAVGGRKRAELCWTVMAATSSASIWLLLNVATWFVFWLGQKNSIYQNDDTFCRNQAIVSVEPSIDILLSGRARKNISDSPGQMLLVYFGLLYITLHAMEVPNFLSLMQIARLNATGVFFIIDWKSRIDNLSNEGKIPKRSAVGRLDFSNVTFRYPQKPDETVLNIRQLTIYSGQFVSFQGPENSGKNTILKLIPRLYDTCSGFIALDAVNIQNYNIRWLRQQMCIISEVPVIFSGTISENILFGKLDASEDEIVKACQLAEVHHVIEKLPDGYETKISGKEYGDHLTRNEKRQLCLARAYLHRSRLILLDNPVQPEDDELEPLLLKFVHHFRDTATVILASTNVTALSKRAECIYYMENGRIIEAGNHIQLIQAKGMYYNRLEGTMNLSVESRNKFESQLKAYKYSQLLQRKRKSSTMGQDGSEERDGSGGGDELATRLWNSILKHLPFSGKRKSLTRGFDPSGEDGLGVEGKESNPVSYDEFKEDGEPKKRQSILRQTRQHQEILKISSLEQSYSRYNNIVRKKSIGNEGYMHHGFGLMGFQRMIFARPMTNYSTQIQKQRHAFSSFFSHVGSQSLKILRDQKFSYYPDAFEDNRFLEGDESERRSSGAHVKFNFVDPHDKAHEDTQSKRGQFRKIARNVSTATSLANQSKKSKGKSSQSKPVAGGKGTASKSNLAINKTKAGKQNSETQLSQTRQRGSVQDFLKGMVHQSFHLNEHMEIDNVSILSEELDSFLTEYDQGVYSTLNSHVKGYWRDIFFVVKHDWLFIIPAMIASILLGLSIPYQAWIVGTFFEVFGSGLYNEQRTRKEIRMLGNYMLITGGITAVAAFTQEFFLAMAVKRMTRRLRVRLFEHILSQDLSWFDEKPHDIGILTFQLYADTMIVHHIVLMTYGIIVQATFNVLTNIALVSVETTDKTLVLTICFIFAMPLVIVIVYLSSKKELTEAEHLEDRFKVPANFAQEFLINIKTWFSLGAESFFISQHKKILDREYRYIKVSSILVSFMHSIVQSSNWLLYAIFIYFVLRTHKHQMYDSQTTFMYPNANTYPSVFTTPTLIGFLMIVSELLIFGAYRVGDQMAFLTDVELAKTAAHKLMRILVNQSETDSLSKTTMSPEELQQEEYLYAPPPEIGLTDITYYYPGASQTHQDAQLYKISMTIASSSYVAIVGPPGSGKSTLCHIILRMSDPTSGVLDFNGDDSFSISPKVTRRQMGYVEYDPCLFDFSIIENIRVGRYNEEEETDRLDVEEATKLSNCHYDILDLPEDYDTEVKLMERTSHNFSLKQRISYARALLRKPKILLVDDATTSVSTDTDHKILEVIANARENRTLIVFSHKIEPVRDADMIFVLWDGEIVESGTDSFLLQKMGYYYEMYMTQKVLADTMRNSPQQLSTIRYNIKKKREPNEISPGESKRKLAEIASKQKGLKRQSSIAFVKFLDEKVNKMKKAKEERRKELETELPELEKEQRELSKAVTQQSKSTEK